MSRRLLGAALPALLVLGACGGADNSVVDEITVEAASLNLSGADMDALERHFTVRPRRASEADVMAALDTLGLGDTVDGRTVDGATVTYTDWTATRDDVSFKADTVVLYGVHRDKDAETATFDAMTMSGVSLSDPDGVNGTVDTITLVEPSDDLAASMIDIIQGGDATDPADDLQDVSDFRALRVEGVDLSVTDDTQSGTISVAQLIVGDDSEDGKDGTSDWVLDTVAMDFGAPGAPDSERTKLTMDGATALGVRGNGAGLAGFSPGMLSSLATQAEPMFNQLVMGAAAFRSPAFDVDFAGLEVDSEASGATLTTTSVLQPMEVRFKDAPGSPVAMFYDTMADNGLADITLKGSQVQVFDSRADTMVVSDSQLEIDEGLRMNCDYGLSGLKAAAQSLESSGAAVPDPTDVQTEEQIDQFMADMAAFQEAQAEANALIGITGLDCTVQDVPGNSLVTRGYAVAADVTGKPVAVLKGGAKTMIALSSMTAQSDFQRDLMDTLGSGLIDFIDTPGQTMRILIDPDAPVSVETLSGENASIKPLNLSVEVQ